MGAHLRTSPLGASVCCIAGSSDWREAQKIPKGNKIYKVGEIPKLYKIHKDPLQGYVRSDNGWREEAVPGAPRMQLPCIASTPGWGSRMQLTFE